MLSRQARVPFPNARVALLFEGCHDERVLRVDSLQAGAPDLGLSFKLYFPRARAEQAPFVTDRAGRKISGGSETILVVEDDAAVRAYVSTQLKGLGYHVLEASTGAEAMEVVTRRHDIDLLFTDVVMPGGMSGRELAEAAQKSHPSLKVLFTSGYTENSIVHNGKLDPGVKLLTKPYRREQLAGKLREVLDEILSDDSAVG